MTPLTKYCVKKLISKNVDIINKTAIKNCHVSGLHSFILNYEPKIRLFLADETCALRKPFDYKNPYLTIHAHRHNDIFIPLTETKIIHHLYKKVNFTDENSVSFRLNMYNRLNIANKENMAGITGGSDWLEYIGPSTKPFLKAKELHTVNILGSKKCAWIIIEIGTDDTFEQLSYGGEQISSDCYQKFNDPIKYIFDFLELQN